MNDNDLHGKRLAFDEFELVYNSTEKVTDRRLETNRWNYSICVAILVAIAALTNWSLGNDAFFLIGIAADLFLSIMAILFCSLWIRQIRDFKSLNNAKFNVLNAMAPHIEFSADHPNTIISYRPFEKEWELLKQIEATAPVRRTNMIALQSSNMEYFIPKAFRTLFVAIALIIAVVILPNWSMYSQAERNDPTTPDDTTQQIIK